MRNLHEIWGQCIIQEKSSAPRYLVKVVVQGVPKADWPIIGTLIDCHDNRLTPSIGELWWVSRDAGNYFLEELIATS